MADLLIRPATAEDRYSVGQLAEDLATSYQVDREAFATIFDRLLRTADALLLVAESDQQVVGYLLAQRHHTFHANGPVVWVEEVMVGAGHRGLGIGRALMKAVEVWAREGDAAYVALATRRAADFYAALGYEPSATYFKHPL